MVLFFTFAKKKWKWLQFCPYCCFCFFSAWGGLVAKSTCNKCFKSIPAPICRWRKDSTRSSNLFFTWPLTLCGISLWVPKRWYINISFLFFLKKMYADLFVGWLDFRFLRPASLESFPLLVISVIKHKINHHHHMWLVWSVSQARQGLEMYPQSHTVKEYDIIGWLVKGSSIYIKERERERRKKTDCTCTWSGWDWCHWSFPGSCPSGWTRVGPSYQPLYFIYRKL